MPPTRSRSAAAHRLPRLAACLSLALLATPVATAALAQGAGDRGGREVAPTGATVPGASLRQRGEGGAVRDRTQERLRGSDAARPPEQDREQLKDLNALSRQLAPAAPVPAPDVRTGR